MATAKSTIFHIHSDRDIGLVTESLKMMKPTEDKPLLVKIGTDHESRSLKQNRLSFLWYSYRGKENGNGKIHERNHCKLHYGKDILLRDDPDFATFFHAAITPLPYLDQLDAMEYVPVTSLMNMHQFAEYLNEVDQQSASRGIVLPQPADLYWDALMKEEDK